jgi:hypothetical protein
MGAEPIPSPFCASSTYSSALPSPFCDGFDLVHGKLTEQQNVEDNSFYLQNREMKFGKRFWAGKHHTLSTGVTFI